MSVHIDDTVLDDYVDGRLTVDDVRVVEEHLATCPLCAENARRLRALIDSLGGMRTDVSPPSDVWERVQHRIETADGWMVAFRGMVARHIGIAASILMLVSGIGTLTAVRLSQPSWIAPRIDLGISALIWGVRPAAGVVSETSRGDFVVRVAPDSVGLSARAREIEQDLAVRIEARRQMLVTTLIAARDSLDATSRSMDSLMAAPHSAADSASRRVALDKIERARQEMLKQTLHAFR